MFAVSFSYNPYAGRRAGSPFPVLLFLIMGVILSITGSVVSYGLTGVPDLSRVVPFGDGSEVVAGRSEVRFPDVFDLLACQGSDAMPAGCESYVNGDSDTVVVAFSEVYARDSGLLLLQGPDGGQFRYVALVPVGAGSSVDPLFCVYGEAGAADSGLWDGDIEETLALYVTARLYWRGGPFFETVSAGGDPTCRIHLVNGEPPAE